GHEALANAAAMRAARVTRDTPTPAGGEILRDPKTGEPIGIFKDQALDLISRVEPDPSPEQQDSALARALAHAASLGITATAHMAASWADLAAYRRLEKAGRLTMRVALYLPLEQWRAVADTVRRAGPGDDWVRIAGLKGFADGSAGARTAAFFQPYADSTGYAGLLQHPPQDLATWIGNADSAGLQVAVHAIGDRANALILSIYDSVTKAHGPRDRRLRVEHAQHPRRQEPERVGARAEDHGGRGPARLYRGECLCDVRRQEAGHARSRLRRGRGGDRPQSVHAAAGVDQHGPGRGHDRGWESGI